MRIVTMPRNLVEYFNQEFRFLSKSNLKKFICVRDNVLTAV